MDIGVCYAQVYCPLLFTYSFLLGLSKQRILTPSLLLASGEAEATD